MTTKFSLELAQPGIHHGLDLFLGVTIALLQQTFQGSAAPLDDVKIVMGQLAPLDLCLAPILFPSSFDLIPVYDVSPQ